MDQHVIDALKFYADPKSYCTGHNGPDVLRDGGRQAKEALERVAKAPAPIGTWPSDCIQRAFVDGAMWCIWDTRGATPFGSERDAAEAEAVRRYGEPEGVKEPQR